MMTFRSPTLSSGLRTYIVVRKYIKFVDRHIHLEKHAVSFITVMALGVHLHIIPISQMAGLKCATGTLNIILLTR